MGRTEPSDFVTGNILDKNPVVEVEVSKMPCSCSEVSSDSIPFVSKLIFVKTEK